MKAAPRLCVCDECKTNYGSCQLFKEYEICCNHLKKNCLRSAYVSDIGAEIEDDGEEHDQDEQLDVLLEGTVVALAADKKAYETFYLIQVTQEECPAQEDETDAWGKTIKVYFEYGKIPLLILTIGIQRLLSIVRLEINYQLFRI